MISLIPKALTGLVPIPEPDKPENPAPPVGLAVVAALAPAGAVAALALAVAALVAALVYALVYNIVVALLVPGLPYMQRANAE